MDYVISQSPNTSMHPGIDISGNIKAQHKKFEVYEPDPENKGRERIRLYTDYEVDLLVSTEKTRDMGAPPVIVTVPDYNRYKNRDGMVIIRQLPIANIREAGWKKRSQVSVSIRDGIYKIDTEEKASQIENKIEPVTQTNPPGRPKKS